MIRQFADLLKNKIVLANLPFVEVVGGVVKAVTYEDSREFTDEQGKVAKITIPVSWHTNVSQCGNGNLLPERDFVPDSSKRGIIYFEEDGEYTTRPTPYGTNWVAPLVLVCWYNKARITEDPYAHVQTTFISMLQQALLIDVRPFTMAPFTRIQLTTTRIQQQDGAVFSPYSYMETERQYLMQPYEYFALEINANFTVNSSCLPPINGVQPGNCRQF